MVNKTAGLVCHPTRDGEMSSLVGRVRLHLGNAEGRLVNRLDRETSGVVLIAKNATTAGALGKLLAASGARKEYWAIVHGHVEPNDLTIDAPLGKDQQSAVAIKDAVRPDGAAARTDIRVKQRFERHSLPFTWLNVAPMTGRKHQIRIHLAHIGHPIVGDKIYGADELRYLRFIDGTLTEADLDALMVTNHLLHARSLSFPRAGREVTFTADPDAAWTSFGGILLTCRT